MNSVNTTKLRAMLQTRNDAQAGQVRALRRSIEQANIFALLEPYKAMLLRVCTECEALIEENELYLRLQQESILEDVLSNTTRVTYRIRLISGRLAVPVLRASESDRLCLQIITWMHKTHPSAANIPAAYSNGNIAVYPFTLTLKQANHPVDWLRVKFLARRARSMGLSVEAEEMEQEWEMVANTLGIREDYHGFYADSLEEIVERTIDNMLVEAAPREFLPYEVAADRNWEPGDTPVLLLNRAWRMFRSDPANYVEWEMEVISRFVA